MSAKKEFGDFQTPLALARDVAKLVDSLIGKPGRVIEPTAGLGAFLHAAFEMWGEDVVYSGFEINEEYVKQANSSFPNNPNIIEQQDFFQTDWRKVLSSSSDEIVLVLGNPPWVTNAALGTLGSNNLPIKTNFQGLKGFDAKTGKSNFDIAEWMLIRLIEALPITGTLAMLCKTSTARKVLKHFWKIGNAREHCSLFFIDAKKHFNVSVDACLLVVKGNNGNHNSASVHDSINLNNKEVSKFGLIDGILVSDIKTYQELCNLAGGSPYIWRSGIKHDASDIMELTYKNGIHVNGFNQTVEIEENNLYPLLKSSDIGNGRTMPRRYVIVTQKTTGEDTSLLRILAPKTWTYLESNAVKLDSRKSSIYRNRPRFSIFGVGDYSFAPWKVAISGLYNTFRFVVVSPEKDTPVMLDDTCYFLSCKHRHEAMLIADLLNSEPSQRFLRSLVFLDSKRPITTEILNRISLLGLADHLGHLDDLVPHIEQSRSYKKERLTQLELVMDKRHKYLIEHS